MQPKLLLLLAAGGVALIVTRIRRVDKAHPKTPTIVAQQHNNDDPHQQDADTSEPSTSGTSPVILTSATTSAITCIVVLTVREHAALPAPHAWRSLVSLLQQHIASADNAAVAVLLIVSLTLMIALGAQVALA